MLLVFTFNWYVHYFHVVVGRLFRNLVARKTHSYYAIELVFVCRYWVAHRL